MPFIKYLKCQNPDFYLSHKSAYLQQVDKCDSRTTSEMCGKALPMSPGKPRILVQETELTLNPNEYQNVVLSGECDALLLKKGFVLKNV